MVSAHITGFGHATPPPMDQQALWDGFFAAHYAHNPIAEVVWARSGVDTRHGVADPCTDDVSQWSTGERMRRFASEALPLSKEAVGACLADSAVAPSDVDALTVVSCTGYATPGLDVLIARDLGMRDDAQRLGIGHMGCYAAIPALATAVDAARARGTVGVVACVELTSLHLQPAGGVGGGRQADREQIVAHALFSDAAAGIAVTAGQGPGLEVLGFAARTVADASSLMSWDVTDLGFRMGLSPQVPKVLGAQVAEAIDGLCAAHGVARGDVARWAIHPGGPRVVDTVAERLGLDEADVATSRATLAAHGNCSSATVLLILERLRDEGLERGDHVVMLAFGPGLTLYAALLRQG